MSKNLLTPCDFCGEMVPYRYDPKADHSDKKNPNPTFIFCGRGCMISFILDDASLNSQVLEAQRP